jgi:hypothetical protein
MMALVYSPMEHGWWDGVGWSVEYRAAQAFDDPVKVARVCDETGDATARILWVNADDAPEGV